MLKYVETAITFSEVPDEITLCINISNCPCHCKGCHSQYLWEDKGTILNEETLTSKIKIIERMVRSSKEYKDYIKCVRETDDIKKIKN